MVLSFAFLVFDIPNSANRKGKFLFVKGLPQITLTPTSHHPQKRTAESSWTAAGGGVGLILPHLVPYFSVLSIFVSCKKYVVIFRLLTNFEPFMNIYIYFLGLVYFCRFGLGG